MKRYIFSLIAGLFFICLLIASCTSTRQNTAFSERKYYNFKHHNPIVVIHTSKRNYVKPAEPKTSQPIISSGNAFLSKAPRVVKTTDICLNTYLNKLAHKPVTHTLVTTPISMNFPSVNSSNYRGIQQEMATSTTTGGNSSVDPVVLVIIAILIPPLAVYLYDNAATTRFWIDLIMFLFGIGFAPFEIFLGLLWLAAIVYAVLIVTGSV